MIYFVATIICLGIMGIAFLLASQKKGVVTVCSVSGRDKGKDEFCGTCSSIVKEGCEVPPN
jgi:hypothetical protein